MKFIKSIIFNIRSLRLAASLGFGLCISSAVFGAGLIQSVEVSPDPLITGRTFTITVTASADVIQATASIDFRRGETNLFAIALTKQAGGVFTGSGTVPSDILRDVQAKFKVSVVDAAGNHDDETAHVDVRIEKISAVFADGTLTITGDDFANNITVIRDAAGKLIVNGGAVSITGGTATVANTTLIRILGRKGNDVIAINEVNGTLPRTNILGEDGNDTITSGSGLDEIDGGPGDDTIFGKGGFDRISGGAGKDRISGGAQNDELFGGDDDDVIDWFPGDGSDIAEGQDGEDTLLFFGGNGSDVVDMSASGPRLLFSRNPGVITMDCDGIEQVTFRAAAGADQINIRDLTDTQVRKVSIDLFNSEGADDAAMDTVTIDGTAASDTITATGSTNATTVTRLNTSVTVTGADQDVDKLVVNAGGGEDIVDASAVQAGVNFLTLNGGNDIDTLTGGHGNDHLVGATGNDTVFGGEGDDTFVWNPGDASDIFEGQAGTDTMLFNGANIGEVIVLSANGSRLLFSRNVATIAMDCNGIEVVQFVARGAADSITINDLSGTDVRDVKLDLSASGDAGPGDSAIDVVTVNGTGLNDVVSVNALAGSVSVAGLPAKVTISGSEIANDVLIVRTAAGDDVINASGLPAGLIALIGDGGDDDDVLTGSAGNDTLLGGEGDDVLLGGPGIDVLDGGPGGNVIIQD